MIFLPLLLVWQRWKRRQGWKGRQSADLQESTPISFVQGWSPVSRRTCSSFPQELSSPGTSCGSYSSCIHFGYSGISDSRSFGIGRQCLQGLESQAYHTPPLAVGDSWRRGTRCSHQSHDCRRRCHSPYSQVAHQQVNQRCRQEGKVLSVTGFSWPTSGFVLCLCRCG